MLANLIEKLHNSLRTLEEHKEQDEEVGANWMSCARCGSNINSLVDALNVRIDEDIHFLCSETCYQRFMKARLNQQIRLSTNLVRMMKHEKTAIQLTA